MQNNLNIRIITFYKLFNFKKSFNDVKNRKYLINERKFIKKIETKCHIPSKQFAIMLDFDKR